MALRNTNNPQLSQHAYELVPRHLKEMQRCANCNELFRESDNTGQLRCRLHPGVILQDTTGRTGSFYSCCGIPIGLFHCGARKTAIEGCLRVDHMSQVLCGDNIERRLAQLQQFATLVVPHLLFSFALYRPQPECVIYTLPCSYQRASQTRFPVLQVALLTALQRHKQRLLTYSSFYVDDEASTGNDSGVGGACDVHVGEDFDVNDRLDELETMARQSTIFDEMLSQEQVVEKRLADECELIWSEKHLREIRPLKQPPLIIPFTLVRRIANELEI